MTDGDEGKATVTKYEYQFMAGSYQQTSSTAKREGNEATTKTWRDANGFVSNIEQVTGASDERFNRAFVNDAQGNAIYVNQGAGHTGRIQNPGTYLGGWVGDSLNPGHVQRQLVAHGEVLARYGDAPDSENPPANAGDVPKYVSTAEFRLNAAPLQLKGANLDAIAYTVVGGETLKDIARNVLGDAKLWWRIAEANGLAVSGDGQLKAGQTLSVPKLALNANSVDTFQPYEPGRVTGSMDPLLPAPAGQGGGCGGVGLIISIVVSAVLMAYGIPMPLASLGGNVAGQATNNITGAQSGFDWKSAAMSYAGGMVSQQLNVPGLLEGKGLEMTVLRAMASNTITQGVGVVTGLQDHFNWKSVAASGLGAAASWGMSYAVGLTDANGERLPQASRTDLFVKAGITSFAGGVSTALAKGGRVSIQQVAVDAFGNALGESIIANARSGSYMGEGTNKSPYVSDGEHLVFNNTAPAYNFARVNAALASAPHLGEPGAPFIERSNDVLVASADRLKITAVTSDIDEVDYARIIADAQARNLQREAERVRRSNWIAEENAVGSAVQYRLGTAPIRETVTPIGFPIVAPGFALDERPSMVAEAVQIAAESTVRAIVELPLMAVDLAQAAGGVVYTEVTGKAANLTMYSGMGRAAEAGATTGELLNGLNPMYGLMVGSYEVRRGLASGDVRPLAALGGGLLGGAMAAKLTPQLPGYRPGWVSPGTADAARYIGNTARDVLGPRVEQWAYRFGGVNYVVPPQGRTILGNAVADMSPGAALREKYSYLTPEARASRMENLAEANAARRLQELESSIPGAHFVEKHGAQTTLEA